MIISGLTLFTTSRIKRWVSAGLLSLLNFVIRAGSMCWFVLQSLTTFLTKIGIDCSKIDDSDTIFNEVGADIWFGSIAKVSSSIGIKEW